MQDDEQANGRHRVRLLGANRIDYSELPPVLVRYVAAVSIAGPIAALAGAALLPATPRPALLVLAMLIALAGLAERFPIHLTHKTHINVSTAVFIAMILTLPPAWCCVAILSSSAAAQVSRLLGERTLGVSEPLFNLGQTALYMSVTAGCISLLAPGPNAASRLDGGHLLVVGVASAVMHLGNTLLVAGASSRHLGLPMARVWRGNLMLDVPAHVALTLVGLTAAQLTLHAPLLVPVLAIPAILVHTAVGQSVELREDTAAALAAMIHVIELRDPYTAGHSLRVSATARLIALDLGLTAEEADQIATAGEVHDIGKVAIDPGVTRKPGKLTDAEWLEMRMHPVLGADVLRRFQTYQAGVEMVRSHHEAIDGSGYPDGLSGEDIPLGARILAVADTFDALTSDRPYRAGMPVARAIDILRDGAGSQWDARIVTSLIGILARTPDLVPLGTECAAASAMVEGMVA